MKLKICLSHKETKSKISQGNASLLRIPQKIVQNQLGRRRFPPSTAERNKKSIAILTGESRLQEIEVRIKDRRWTFNIYRDIRDIEDIEDIDRCRYVCTVYPYSVQSLAQTP